MYILAVNGSPRANKGVTDIVLQKFLEGAKEAGAKTECVYLVKKNIKNCRGCYACWIKTPGKCVIKDDMAPLLEKVKKTDMLVLATPIHTNTMTSYMKAFTERLIPLVQPFQEKEKNRYVHPKRFNYNIKVLVISVCGFPDKANFDSLILTVMGLAKMCRMEYIGAITRTGGEFLREAPRFMVKGFLNQVKRAGEEAGRTRTITRQLLAKVNKSHIPDAFLAKAANKWWRKQIKNGNSEDLKSSN